MDLGKKVQKVRGKGEVPGVLGGDRDVASSIY